MKVQSQQQPAAPESGQVMLNIFEKAFWEAYEESKETREFLRRKSEEYTAAKARMATNAVNGHGAGISQSSETER